jgi:organic radical activating enzyme
VNTIKFAPYDDFVTEQHDVEHASVDTVKVGETEYRFYNPCNLNVFITNTCQNACDFCINKGQTDQFRMGDATYYEDLENGLEKLSGVKLEATITGGEPTLLPRRLVETVRILVKHGVHERTVSTTGIGLLEKYEGKTVFQHLIENGYTHNISISRMAEDEWENDRIMMGEKYSSRQRNIGNDDLRRLATIAKANGVQLRTSTNLLAGFVDTYQKMLHFVDFQYKNGIESCLFRELEGKMQKMAAPIAWIAEAVRSSKDFAYIKTVHGMFYDIELYLYTSHETGMTYIVKVYTNHVVDADVIGSLSFNHGIIRKGFHGEAL